MRRKRTGIGQTVVVPYGKRVKLTTATNYKTHGRGTSVFYTTSDLPRGFFNPEMSLMRRRFKRGVPYRKTKVAARYRRRSMPARMRGFYRKVGYYKRFTGDSGELKFHDVDLSLANIPQIGLRNADLLTIAEGNGEEERIGRKITIKSILIRANALLPGGTNLAQASETVRFMVVQDTQANGAQAAATDVLETANYKAFNNLANSSRFRVMLDKQLTLRCSAGSGNGTTDNHLQNEYNFNFYKKCSIPIEYDNTASTGAISTIRSNNILVFAFGRAGGIADISGKIRFRFADK